MPNASRIRELLGARTRAHGATIEVADTQVQVTFDRGRAQRVNVEEEGAHIILQSVAVRDVRQHLRSVELDERILRTNHATDLAGLRRYKGALVAFAKVLAETLDRDEAIHVILAVAREADRLEEVIVGRDDE